MNGTRKITLILLAIIVICLCITGCGKKDKNPVSASNGGKITTSSHKTVENITYFLKSVDREDFFELSLYVPDGYPIEITDFELWADNQQVGERTRVDLKLRHLTINFESFENVWIRLYNQDDFLADCKIDPSKESGSLEIDLSNVLEH